MPDGYALEDLGGGWVAFRPGPGGKPPAEISSAGISIPLPVPSDPDFPNLVQAVFSWLEGIADDLYQWVQSGLENGAIWMYQHQPEYATDCGWTAPASCIQNVLVGVVRFLMQIGSGALEALRATVETIFRTTIRSPVCNPLGVTALIAIRYMWDTQKSAVVGVNIFGQAQVKIGYTSEQVDALLHMLLEYACPMGLPPLEQAVGNYMANEVPYANVEVIARAHGLHPAWTKMVVQSCRERLFVDEIIESTRRGTIPANPNWHGGGFAGGDETTIEASWQEKSLTLMRGRGWINQSDAIPRYQLYDEIPTIAQHLHWLSRNVDDVQYVADYHLLDGFSTDTDCAQLLGLSSYTRDPQVGNRNFWDTFGLELRVQGMRKIDAAREYAAHWLHASPQQLAAFMFRLRPDRSPHDWEYQLWGEMGWTAGPQGEPPPQAIFTTNDFNRILAEQDIAPRDVGWFLSTMYHVPALSYLRDMYRYSVFSTLAIADGKIPADSTPEARQAYDDNVLGQYHQDLGYSPQDSARFVAVDGLLKARIRTSESQGWTPARLSEAYALQQITEDKAREEMARQGFTAQETTGMLSASGVRLQGSVLRRALSLSVSRTITQLLSAYRAGWQSEAQATGALGQLGIPAKRAAAMIHAEAMARTTALYREAVASIRGAYRSGRVDDGTAEALLQKLGMDPDAVEVTLGSWNIQKAAAEKGSTRAEIRKALADGIIGPTEAKERWQNLGLGKPAIDLLLAEVKYATKEAEKKLAAKEQAAAEKEAERRAAEASRSKEKMTAAQERAAAAAEKEAERVKAKAEAAVAKVKQEAAAVAYIGAALAARSDQAMESALEAAAKAAQGAAAKAIAALKAEQSPADLERYAKLGLIDYSYFRRRLLLYGWDETSIDLAWDGACASKSAACLDPAVPVAGTGGSEDSSSTAGT